jgi:NAD(P)-dependent dehydrogenase (short-subunit alcohol dehydrogenase family)
VPMVGYNFKDRVALVTGAGSGMGRAAAGAFAAAGAAVAVLDVDAKGVDGACAAITAAGGTALALQVDVSNEPEVAEAVAQAVREFGRLDFAFNCAGILGASVPASEMRLADWDRLFGIDLAGVWLCMKYELRVMLEKGTGSIINASSTAGIRASPGLAAYTAAKHGVVGLTKSAAVEAAPRGVRINAVCPGAIATPMMARSAAEHPDLENELARKIPLGRLGSADEVSAAVLWLASDASSYVTGQALVVDGGRTL